VCEKEVGLETNEKEKSSLLQIHANNFFKSE
jgi:hypothetical protein